MEKASVERTLFFLPGDGVEQGHDAGVRQPVRHQRLGRQHAHRQIKIIRARTGGGGGAHIPFCGYVFCAPIPIGANKINIFLQMLLADIPMLRARIPISLLLNAGIPFCGNISLQRNPACSVGYAHAMQLFEKRVSPAPSLPLEEHHFFS
jgi:hypothetical protein